MSDSNRNIRIGGRTVAVVRGHTLDVRRHSNGFLQVPPGIALSVQTVEAARQAGASQIEVTNLDSGTKYSISLSDFMAHSWRIERGGFESQIAAALDRFERQGAPIGNVQAAFKSYDRRQASQDRQLALFG